MKQLILIVSIQLYVHCSFAQPTKTDISISIGTTSKVHSSILNESRELYVHHPEKINIPLPLIVVFDGESLFTSVVSAVQFMNYAQELPQMPEAVVVGIPNTDRNRDMPIPQMYGGKGEEDFLRFLSDELIPYLQKNYQLNGHVVLIGHSQGGLFVSYAMAQLPKLFTGVIAMDAPMSVDSKTTTIKQKIARLVSEVNSKSAYASMEAVYGWGKDWDASMTKSKGTVRMEYPGETHESMPHKAIYDGLKFIYKGFAPPKRDMKLIPLLHYYENVSAGFGFPYEVPGNVLLASANRQIMESRKDDALELLQFAEEKYGSSERLLQLRAKASKLVKAPDPLVDFYLNHPAPSADEVKPYIGRWVGELNVRDGQALPIDMEIKIENGKGKMISVLPWPPYDKIVAEIFFVDKEGKLVFGRKNRGAGVVISAGAINTNGHVAGEEKLIGFSIPDDMPEDIKVRMKFVMENPNTFDIKRMR